MAYPIFFCIFSKYIVLYVYKIKEERPFQTKAQFENS